MEKACSKCKTVYKEPLLQWFYASKHRALGLASQCKKCASLGQSRRGRQNRANSYYEKYKHKNVARKLAREHYGTAKNYICAVLGCELVATELHHVDYAQALRVIPLCTTHHKGIHDVNIIYPLGE